MDDDDDLMNFNWDEYLLDVASFEGELIETDDILLDVEGYII